MSKYSEQIAAFEAKRASHVGAMEAIMAKAAAEGSTLDASQAPVADLIRQATDGDGFDTVFDATGNTASVQSAFAHVAHGGTLVLVSVVKDDITFSDPEFHKREMSVVGSRNATRQDFDHVATSIRTGAVPLDKLVTHRTTLDDTQKDLARWAKEKSGLIKAVIAVG